MGRLKEDRSVIGRMGMTMMMMVMMVTMMVMLMPLWPPHESLGDDFFSHAVAAFCWSVRAFLSLQ